MSARYECRACRQPLRYDEFRRVGSRRHRERECEVCRHQRLAREHRREAELLLARRRRLDEEDAARMEAARAAAGRD